MKEERKIEVRKISDDIYEVDSKSQEGKSHRVRMMDGTWHCDCTGFTIKGTCSHINLVGEKIQVEKVKDSDSKNTYKEIAKKCDLEIRSAFHKSIRTGDVTMAGYWGLWFSILDGNDKVNEYVKTITFEETCNWKLFYRYTDDWVENVRLLAASKKIWECKCCNGFLVRQMMASQRAQADPLEKGEEIEIKSIDDGYKLMYHGLLKKKKDSGRLLNSILELLKKNAEGKLPIFIMKRLKYKFDVVFLINFMFGMLDEEECCLIDEERFKSAEKLMELGEGPKEFPDYTYDVHTEKGAKLILENWKEISKGKDVEGLDLRWAGLSISKLWRELAVEKFGNDYKNASWSGVDIPSDLWELAVYEDRWNTVYKQIEDKYSSLVFKEKKSKEEVKEVEVKDKLSGRDIANAIEVLFEKFVLYGEQKGGDKLLEEMKKGENVVRRRMILDIVRTMDKSKTEDLFKILELWEKEMFDEPR